jgi:hypothetical protein
MPKGISKNPILISVFEFYILQPTVKVIGPLTNRFIFFIRTRLFAEMRLDVLSKIS